MQAHSLKARNTAAVVEFQRGRWARTRGVGLRSVARKWGITQPSLREMHANIQEDGIFELDGWEAKIIDSGWVSGDLTTSEEDD